MITASQLHFAELFWYILNQWGNNEQKYDFNSSIPATMTIFPQIPQALLRGESVKDICSLSSQSEHAFNAIDRLRIY